MLRPLPVFSLCIVLALSAQAQLQWTLSPELNRGLPAGVTVFTTATEVAAGVPTSGVYARAKLDDRGIAFESLVATGGALTPRQFADQHFDTFRDSVYVAINGGFFSATASLSLAISDGRLLAPNVRALTRPFGGRDTTYFPTRGAFGIDAARRPELGWVYTTTGDSTYFYDDPAPNALGRAPLARPSKNFPNGARLWEVVTAIGGAPVLVDGGVIRITAAEELIDVENDSRQPRSAIGYTASGELLLVAIDGRRAGVASGVTLAELARIMLDLGAVAALNLDGGGSTGLVVNGATANRPSDATGLRPVRSAFVIKKTNRVLDTETATNYAEPLGSWGETSNAGFFGPSRARITGVATPATRSARYTFGGLAPGRYRIGAWWVAAGNRAINTPYVLRRGGVVGGPDTVRFDQSKNGSRFNAFVLSDGTDEFELSAGDTLTVFNAATGAGSAVFATVDAVKFERVGAAAELRLSLAGGVDSFSLGRLDTLRTTVTYASRNSGVLAKAYRVEVLSADGTARTVLAGALPQNLRGEVPVALPLASLVVSGRASLRFVVEDTLGRAATLPLKLNVLPDLEIFFEPDNRDTIQAPVESDLAVDIRLRRLVASGAPDTFLVQRLNPGEPELLFFPQVFTTDTTLRLFDTVNLAVGQYINYVISVRGADRNYTRRLTVEIVDEGPTLTATGAPLPTFVSQGDSLALRFAADSRRTTVGLQKILLRYVSPAGDTTTVVDFALGGRAAPFNLDLPVEGRPLGRTRLVAEIVRADGRRASLTYDLVVGPARGDTRMVVISDFNSAFGSVTYGWEVDSIAQRIPRIWQPDLVVSGGDMIAGQSPALTPEQVDAMWAGFDRAVATPIRAAGIPYVFTIGNHDGAIPVDSAAAERYWNDPRHFPGWVPVDTTNYPFYMSFFGDSSRQNFFIAWNASDANLSDAELAWVEAQLSTDIAKAARHRFVVGHLPLYASSNERNSAGNILNDSERLRELLERNDVHTYISGHHHAFYPAKRGQLELLNAGAAGSGPRSWIGLDEVSPNTVTVVDVFAAANPRYGRDTLVYTTYETRYRDAADMPIFDDTRLPEVMFSYNGQYHIRRDLQLTSAGNGSLSALNVTDNALAPSGSGEVSVARMPDGRLRVEGTFRNLRGRVLPEPSAVAIYRARHNEQGTLVATLEVNSTDGTSGSFGESLPAGLLSAELLTVGSYYVTVRTTAAPTGEVRTQLYRADNQGPAAVTFADTLARGVVPIRDEPAVLVQEWARATDPELDPVTYYYQAALDSAFTSVVFQEATGQATRVLLSEAELYALIGERGRGDSLRLYRRVIASDGRNLNFRGTGALTLVRSDIPIAGDITLPAPGYRFDCTAGRDEFTGACLAAFAKTGFSNGHGVAVDGNSRVWAAAFSGGLRVTNPDGTPYTLTDPAIAYSATALPYVVSVTVKGETIDSRNIRGLGRAADGNILMVIQNSRLLKLDAVTGHPLRYWRGPTSFSNPSVDSAGRVLLVSVVGNRAFLLKETLTDSFDLARPEFALPSRPSVIRAAAISYDGASVFLPSNGAGGIQRYVFSADTGYALVDTISTDNSSNSITTAPGGRVYAVVNRGATAPKLVYREYSPTGRTFAWELPLDEVASTDLRGVSFTPDRDTFYVVNSTNGDVQRYVRGAGGGRTEDLGPAAENTIPGVRPNDGAGRNLLSGRRVRLRGAVISDNQVPYGLSFYLAELGAGLQVYSDTALQDYVPVVGDSLEVTGVLRQPAGQLQLRLDSLRVLGKSRGVRASDERVVEANEGYFVRLDSVRLRSPDAWAPGGLLGFSAALAGVEEDSVQLYVGRQTVLYNLPAPRGRFRVRGLLDQRDATAPFDGGYLVRPLRARDIELYIEPVLRLSADSVCAGDSVTLSATTSNPVGNAARYTWLRGGEVLAQAVGRSSLTVGAGDTSAVYSVRVKAGGADLRYGYAAADSTGASAGLRLRVLDRPAITGLRVVGDTTEGSDIQLQAAVGDAARVEYYAPDGRLLPDGKLDSARVSDSGRYTAVAFGRNGCASDTASVRLTVVKSSGTRELASVMRFEVYPNPVAAGGTVSVALELTAAANLELVDALGRVISTRAVPVRTRGVLELPAPAEAGVYTLWVTNGEGSVSRALVVE